MACVIGTDEAGYGPNLGPLAVAASVWEVPDGLDPAEMYDLLARVIARDPRDCAPAGPDEAPPGKPCLAVADSKALYSRERGLRLLERAVLGTLAALGRTPHHWTELIAALGADDATLQDARGWYPGHAPAVPHEIGPDEAGALRERLCAGLGAAGARLADLRAALVFPARFNALVDERGSKGEVLSHQTLALAARLAADLPGPVTVVCDKHGGRNRYLGLLAAHFPDSFIEVRAEGRARSVYRFGPEDRRVEFRFETKAESYLPTALASMTAKYLRELAMMAFNSFWLAEVPGLAPTAGYPADARRFKAAIARRQAELGIEDRTLWRSR